MKLLTEYLSTNFKSPSEIIYADDGNIHQIVQDEIKKLGTNANLNHINVSRVTNFSDLFFNVHDFNGDVSRWDMSNARNISFMFSVTSFDGDLSNWNLSNCEIFNSAFNHTPFFTGKGLENWKFKKAKNMEYMFHNTLAFTGKQIENWKIPSSCKKFNCMFKNCHSLSCDLSKWNLEKISINNKSEMFDYCYQMKNEWLPKGINPNLVKFTHNYHNEKELRHMI